MLDSTSSLGFNSKTVLFLDSKGIKLHHGWYDIFLFILFENDTLLTWYPWPWLFLLALQIVQAFHWMLHLHLQCALFWLTPFYMLFIYRYHWRTVLYWLLIVVIWLLTTYHISKTLSLSFVDVKRHLSVILRQTLLLSRWPFHLILEPRFPGIIWKILVSWSHLGNTEVWFATILWSTDVIYIRLTPLEITSLNQVSCVPSFNMIGNATSSSFYLLFSFILNMLILYGSIFFRVRSLTRWVDAHLCLHCLFLPFQLSECFHGTVPFLLNTPD